MAWTRPAEPAIPTVWYTFQARDADDSADQLVSYRVQDLTPDRYEDMIQHYKDCYVDDEPLCENRKLSQDDASRRGLESFWRWCFDQKMTIVCYKEGSSEIVAANLLHVKSITDEDDWPIESQKIQDLIETTEYMTKQFDVFRHYNVDHCLKALGLAVNRRYRGRGIATEMLKARIPLCRGFGIQLTTTYFTAVGSQRAAEKAGFETNLEKTFDDFAKMGPTYSFPGIKTKSMKLMSMRI